MTNTDFYGIYKAMCEKALEAYPFSGAPETSVKAMRYSLLAGGKRLRGVLALGGCVCAGGRAEDALPASCAVEMVHAYSLIHDDLPAMDNDTLRRGKPTNHVVFGEAQAILAGDGLLTEAFVSLSSIPDPSLAAACVCCLAEASGSAGMVGGQVMDMEKPSDAGAEWLREMERRKTGCLIRAAVELGMICAGADTDMVRRGREYGTHLGAAFQAVDDILDVTGDEKSMGKSLGKDRDENKLTAVTLFGLDEAVDMARRETALAVEALRGLGHEADFLRQTAEKMLKRVN
ncbi:MAG: polyprenyl synthetase family protein [Clostridia bacterium]|nr:polyprenyl synthetase family protein [Clostridia bacterium]